MKKGYDNWEWKKLGEVCEFVRGPFGGSLKKDIFKPEGYAVYEQQHAIYDQFEDIRYFIDEKKFNEMKRFELKSGDLIMSCSGTMGKMAIVPEKIKKGIINQALLKLTPSKKISTVFLKLWMQSGSFQDSLKACSQGAAIQNVASVKILKEIKIPIPSLPTQHRIVSILEHAGHLKNLRQEANDETNTIIQALFYEMFGDPIKNNQGYTIKPLVEICHRITDGTHVTPKYTEKGIPFLRVTDLTNSNDSKKFISEEEHKELIRRCKPDKGDILYSKNGTIGIAKLIDWDYEFSIFVSLCLIKPKIDIILPKYLEIFLNTPFALRQALLHSKKGTITNLHLIEIKKILVPVPSLKEQVAFLKRVEQINNIQNNQTQSTEEINTLFDALMQKAFNGELVM